MKVHRSDIMAMLRLASHVNNTVFVASFQFRR